MPKKVANAAAGRLDTETYSVSTWGGQTTENKVGSLFQHADKKKRPLLKEAKDVIVLLSNGRHALRSAETALSCRP